MATRSGASDTARSSGALFSKNSVGEGWNAIVPHISGMQREASGRLSNFKQNDLLNMKRMLSMHTSSMWESLWVSGEQFFQPRKSKGMPTSTIYIRSFLLI